MKVICISGSVGTGKTTLAKKLSKKFSYKNINVNNIIKKNKLSEGFDRKRKSYIVDTKKLNKLLINEINEYKLKKIKGVIIDSHMSHYLPKKYVDLCIITKCGLKELEKGLKKRKYSKNKIKENLECEIFDICLNEAKEAGHTVIIQTKSLNIDNVSKMIK